MSLLPEQATFEELVCDCFLAFRGSGLMLSALDTELLGSWAKAEVPYEVVARGIRRAAEQAAWDVRPGEPILRSLRACKRQVEREIRQHQSRAVGSRGPVAPEPGKPESPEPYDVKRHRALRSSLEKLGEARPALGGEVQALRTGLLAHPPAGAEDATRRTDVVVCRLLRALAFDERQELLREARSRVGQVRMSSRARKLALRFHRTAVLSQALGVLGL
jgi:hypothetical protein